MLWLKILGMVCLLGVSGVAWAEEGKAPVEPDYVPFVVDKAGYEAVKQYLGGLRYFDALPLMGWLEGQEQKAKAQWAADHAPKDEGKGGEK